MASTPIEYTFREAARLVRAHRPDLSDQPDSIVHESAEAGLRVLNQIVTVVEGALTPEQQAFDLTEEVFAQLTDAMTKVAATVAMVRDQTARAELETKAGGII